MKAFMDKDFLLETPTAQHLYHDYSAKLPIVDYHCHIPPQEIYEDRRFENIAQVWLGGHQVLADGSDYIFQDRTIYEDAHIFADNLHEMGLMTSRDFMTYMRIFDLTTNLVPQPDVLIYLRASIPTLVAQIKRRGREYEMNIDENYLRRLNEKYECWIGNIYKGDVLIVDKDVEDFVQDASVFESICERLARYDKTAAR